MERLLVCVFSCKMSTPDQYEEEREEKEEKYKNQNNEPSCVLFSQKYWQLYISLLEDCQNNNQISFHKREFVDD